MLSSLKITKVLILLFIVFTLFLNIVNSVFAINYQNTYNKYNSALISSAGDDDIKLKEACQNVQIPVEEHLVYKKLTAWSFIAIIISLIIILTEFVLVKSKIILFSRNDWKYLKIITLIIFLSAVIFAYAPLFIKDEFCLVPCWEIWSMVQ